MAYANVSIEAKRLNGSVVSAVVAGMAGFGGCVEAVAILVPRASPQLLQKVAPVDWLAPHFEQNIDFPYQSRD